MDVSVGRDARRAQVDPSGTPRACVRACARARERAREGVRV
jgi:hypothetical protein